MDQVEISASCAGLRSPALRPDATVPHLPVAKGATHLRAATAVVLLVTLLACGGSSSPPTSPPSETPPTASPSPPLGSADLCAGLVQDQVERPVPPLERPPRLAPITDPALLAEELR